MANPFLAAIDYRPILHNLMQIQDELKQLEIALEQLKTIIQTQPTLIPLRYTKIKPKYKPKSKKMLKKLVEDESVYLGDIDTSAIIDMRELFKDSKRVDFSGIEYWNVSKVTTMRSMFANAKHFNQPIGAWNVESVTDMSFMFANAVKFYQVLDNWNVCNVTSMHYMFHGAYKMARRPKWANDQALMG